MARGTFAYAGQRCLHALAVLLGVSLVTCAAPHAAGDPDQPFIGRYWLFLRHALHGDFGQSLTYRHAVLPIVVLHLPATLLLCGSALALALGLSLPLAVAAATRGDWAGSLLRIVSAIGLAMPGFWLGLMLVLIVSIKLRLLPASGCGGAAHLALPSISLALPAIARLGRLIEPAMRDVLRTDYICAARARGLLEWRVIWVHGMRNLLAPLVAMAGLEFAGIVSLAVTVEVVFAWPGIGRLAATALAQHDFPLLQGIVFIAGLGFVLINLVTDVVSARLDPRGRLG